jgi:hypothetical protein
MRFFQKGMTWIIIVVVAEVCLAQPRLVPTPNAEIEGANSLVYCPTLQIAWEGLERLVGGPIEMQDQVPLVAELNNGHCPTNVVPEAAHVFMAGSIRQGIKQKIEEAIRSKFGSAAPTLTTFAEATSNDMVAYSCLVRELPFPKKFVRSATIPLAFKFEKKSMGVEFFGVPPADSEKYARYVDIIHYGGDYDYSIRLRSQIKGEYIVLSMMSRPDTLAEGIEIIRQQLESPRKDSFEVMIKGERQSYMNVLSRGEILAIPVMNLKIARNFDDACGRLLKNKGFEGAYLLQVYQDIAFKMDESGASVRSQAVAELTFMGEPPKPRRFAFDRPFLMTVWQEKAPQPYLAIWVASPDILVPFNSRK